MAAVCSVAAPDLEAANNFNPIREPSMTAVAVKECEPAVDAGLQH